MRNLVVPHRQQSSFIYLFSRTIQHFSLFGKLVDRPLRCHWGESKLIKKIYMYVLSTNMGLTNHFIFFGYLHALFQQACSFRGIILAPKLRHGPIRSEFKLQSRSREMNVNHGRHPTIQHTLWSLSKLFVWGCCCTNMNEVWMFLNPDETVCLLKKNSSQPLH